MKETNKSPEKLAGSKLLWHRDYDSVNLAVVMLALCTCHTTVRLFQEHHAFRSP